MVNDSNIEYRIYGALKIGVYALIVMLLVVLWLA
jgi:hypothetical protein